MKDNHTWVICAYGESDYLEACIQSLKNQTLQSQIICYSSTPLDSIKELCQRYAIPFYTKQGGGIGKDWNNAISFVETKYATIAHQDDYYEPRYVEKVLAKMEKTSDVLIGYSDYFEEKKWSKDSLPIPPPLFSIKWDSITLTKFPLIESSGVEL